MKSSAIVRAILAESAAAPLSGKAAEPPAVQEELRMQADQPGWVFNRNPGSLCVIGNRPVGGAFGLTGGEFRREGIGFPSRFQRQRT